MNRCPWGWHANNCRAKDGGIKTEEKSSWIREDAAALFAKAVERHAQIEKEIAEEKARKERRNSPRPLFETLAERGEARPAGE